MKARIAWIDVAKALGIVLVVWGHELPAKPGDLLVVLIFAFHMPLFFFLSGLTAKSGAEMAPVEVRRSVTSLVIPYVIYSLVSIALWLAHEGQLGAPAAWLRLVGEMVYGISADPNVMRYNIPLWFFTCLVATRLLFIGLTRWLVSPRAVLLAVVALAGAAHASFQFGLPRLPWNIDVAMVALVFYAAGHAFRRRHMTVGSLREGKVLGALVLALAGLLAVSHVNGRVDMNPGVFGLPVLFYLGGLAGIVATLVVARAVDGFGWLCTIGRASIVIFPVHALFMHFNPFRLFNVVEWYGMRATGSLPLALLAVSLVKIALCLPLYAVFLRWAPEMLAQRRPVRTAAALAPT